MTEPVKQEAEVKQEEVKVEEKQEVVEQLPEPTPAETQAREQGWVSKSEWVESGRSADEWRPAKEFVERGELYRSIHSTKRELKQTQAALTALQRHHQYIFEKAHQTALRDLKAEKRAAIKEGDHEYAEDVESRIEEVQEQYQKDKAQIQQSNVPNITVPEFEEFTARNTWYVTDEDLRDEADALGFVYLNRGGDPKKLLQHVERKMKEKFPEKLGIKKAAPSPVAQGDKTLKSSKQDTFELDEMERDIMNSLIKSGEMTEAQYKAELKKAKGIK